MGRIHVTIGRLVAVLSLATACSSGGSTAPPPAPPPPVVTTVEVAPASATLNVGDTLPLAATVKDQNGAVMSGKTVTWSSTALAVATVSTTGLVTAVTAGSATIAATVDGKTGSTQVTVSPPAPLVVDPATAVNDSIGPRGGTLTTTAGNGVVFTLTIPAHALLTPRRITMTPVKSMGQLPFTGGLLGGVDLQPAGLRLAVPAKLQIKAPTTPPAGFKLVGFSYQGQADSLAPAAMADSGASATLLVFHFSGAGGAFGTPLQIATFLNTGKLNNQSSAFYFVQLVAATAASPRDFNAELQLMRDWMTHVIIPAIQAAQNDFGLVLAVSEYGFWLQLPILYGITGASNVLAPERAAAAAAVAPKLRAAIAANNAECVTNRELNAASNALFWQTQAQEFGIDTPVEQLDRRTVLAGLCIQVVFTRVDYPDPAPAGQAKTLDVRAGLKFGSDPNLDLQPFSWTVDIHGSTHDGQQTGTADVLGQFNLQVTPTGQAPLNILVTECLVNNAVPYFDVCADQLVLRAFGRTIVGDVTVSSDVGLTQISDVAKIDGNLTIVNVTSSDLHELSLLTEVTGNLTIAVSTSITNLTGLASLTKVGGNLRLYSLPHITTLAPLGALTYGGLDVEKMDGLTSLSGLLPAPATMTGSIRMVNNKSLLSATIFRNVTSIGGALDIRGNPLLTNLNDVGPVTHVGGDVVIGGTGLTTIARLANLQTIDGGLRLMVNDLDGLSAFELPALTTVGGDLPTDVTRFVSTPTKTSVLTIRFAALANIIGGVIGGGHNSGAVRPFDLFLPVLQAVGQTAGAVNIAGTPGLRNLTVGALNTAAFVVNVGNNPDLETLVIGSASTASTFNIDGNPSLKSIQVNGVFQVDGSLNIGGNASLVSIHFGGPIQIGGTMNIDGNKSLTSIQFSGGTVGGTLNIDNNAVLSSLTGPLSSVGGTLNVDGNPKLSTQAAMAWAAGISAGGGKNFVGNGTP